MLQTVAGPVVNVNVSRAVTRLKTIYLTFDNNTRDLANKGYTLKQPRIFKDFNSFYHPLQGGYSVNRELEVQVQIGRLCIPQYPKRSLSEAWYQLLKTLGIHSSAFHSISPSYRQYMDNNFIVGIDCEKILEAGWTGLNTKSGQLLSIKTKYTNGAGESARMFDKLYVVLEADQVLEIRDTGATVFD